jgi:hypothetical protein
MLMKRLGGALATVLIVAIDPALAQDTRVTLTFTPQSKTPAFDAAAAEYRSVFEGPSMAGLLFNRAGVPVGARDPMRLRASYSADNKKGTLVHELGHRMNLNLRTRPQDLDEHRLLFLYLYDLYVDLYGQEFADGQVAVGRTLKGLYDYDTAWTWTLAMTREARASRLAGVLARR